MRNDKYVVFKRSDYELVNDFSELRGYELDDAEVIRTQDIFAAPGLYAYANCIQTGNDLMRLFGNDHNDEIERLEEIRDHFAQAAHEAEERTDSKVPD